ncbi:hypothetical protein F442_04671 [Phytophthora nicotianae P10297]|uniref:Uncharacterized protein n=3 Tax=Phytophthora nicotianae TaxID=4792 RepID=W2QJ41_PHYN3|nr:hypothetical protein PPTG_22429 [Phytophthora nicotianae INRA-310]ETI52173.1 hypothetical protein F443_04622 [Phytophthora nicotianae P1569]ETN12906.1 hypothetical protein PPTG_22429 [Phytophthora nicotianae INRA-310]ETP49893.1 hypothetical protein F442_04671 [Phytophthora nicotianae P10297]
MTIFEPTMGSQGGTETAICDHWLYQSIYRVPVVETLKPLEDFESKLWPCKQIQHVPESRVQGRLLRLFDMYMQHKVCNDDTEPFLVPAGTQLQASSAATRQVRLWVRSGYRLNIPGISNISSKQQD